MRPSVLAFCLSASALASAFACPSLTAQGTSDFFQARILPRDRSVNLQLDPNGKDIDWQITPRGVPAPIHPDELLLTYSDFKIGYLHYNPLTSRLEASVNNFDDPAHLALQKLIDGMTSVAGIIAGSKADLLSAGTALDTKTVNIGDNLHVLNGKLATITDKVRLFNTDAATKERTAAKLRGEEPQPTLEELAKQQAIQAARIAQLEEIQNQLAESKKATEKIKVTIYGDGENGGAEAALKQVRLRILKWPEIINTAWGVPGTTGSAAIGSGITEITKELSSDDGNLSCMANGLSGDNVRLNCIATTLQDSLNASKTAPFSTGDEIRLLNHLDTLIAQVNSSKKAIADLIATLREDQDPAHWTIDNPSVFLIGTVVAPTLSTGKEVTVTFTPLILRTTEDGLMLEKQTPITATFRARRYRALMPEVGVGAVLGYIDRPKYGTGLDANGKTVVALGETDRVSIDPSVMVNFVCHCNAGGIAPMLQMGAATSKDLPALLLGGGFRLFGLGKGDVGIGGGLLLGWYKDLQKLKVGSPVGGTADIDADMGYITTPKAAPYISLQYKF